MLFSWSDPIVSDYLNGIHNLSLQPWPWANLWRDQGIEPYYWGA